MFFYAGEDVFNVIATLAELETGALLLGQPGAPFNPEYRRWEDYAAAIARAMETGGKIHVTMEPPDPRDVGRWRGPLADAPEPCRSAVDAALSFFARRRALTFDRATVEVIGLGGSKDPKR